MQLPDKVKRKLKLKQYERTAMKNQTYCGLNSFLTTYQRSNNLEISEAFCIRILNDCSFRRCIPPFPSLHLRKLISNRIYMWQNNKLAIYSPINIIAETVVIIVLPDVAEVKIFLIVSDKVIVRGVLKD